MFLRPSDKVFGCKQTVDSVFDGVERGVCLDTVDKVIVAALLLHDASRVHRMFADKLMQFLPVAARFYAFHKNDFRRHKRQFSHNVFSYRLFVNDKPVCNVEIQFENRVEGKERLRHNESAVSGIVEGAFQPLCTGGDRRVHGQGHSVARKGANALAAHRIAFVRHCRRTYLGLFKRLFYLLHILEQANVVAEFVSALGDLRKNAQNIVIVFAGICLS